MSEREIERLAEFLRGAERALFFTGAGISTGSGIPDFRGPNGVWKRRQPVFYQQFLASEEARVEHWEYKSEGYEAFRDARPNAAHLAIVRLEKEGRLEAVVTQNIDGLHQKAGHAEGKVIELHGTNRRVECVVCGKDHEPAKAFEFFRNSRRCPTCECGGFLKAATVMFGQAMPADKMQAAAAAVGRADLVVSVGTTLEVEPAASIPRARKRSVPYVILNQGPTAHDRLADLRIEGDVVSLLPAAVDLAFR